MRCQTRGYPQTLLLINEPERTHVRDGHRYPTAGFLCQPKSFLRNLFSPLVEHRSPGLRKKTIKKDQAAQSFTVSIRNSSYDAGTKAVPDENHVLKVFEQEMVFNVLNERFKIDALRQEVLALAEPGLRRRRHRVSPTPKKLGDVNPAPAAVPGAVHEDESLTVGVAHRGQGSKSSG
jgi:hypothetical protein